MGLRELIGAAVRPRLNRRFAGLLDVTFNTDDEEQKDDEDSDVVGSLDSLAGLSVVIDYKDSRGQLSQRAVTCRQYVVRGEISYIKTYCHHRKKLRDFRIDRIVDIYDAVTGECLSPVQRFFAKFAPDKIAKSGLSWGLSVGRRADLIALINALVFLARCDKDFHPSERSVLEEAITQFWLRMEIQADADFDDIMNFSEKLAPDGEIFWLAMHRFREETILANVFRLNAHRLIQADGVVRPEESYWIVEIDDFLNGD